MKEVLLRAQGDRAPITIAVARGRTSFFLAEIPLEFQQEKRCQEITPPAAEYLNAEDQKLLGLKIEGRSVLEVRDRLGTPNTPGLQAPASSECSYHGGNEKLSGLQIEERSVLTVRDRLEFQIRQDSKYMPAAE